MAFDSGRVSLRLAVEDGRVAAVEVRAERPSVAAALRGKPAEQAVALVPLLFSLCGRAQGLAARLALAAARGETTPARRDEAVAREIAGEHLWRLLMDWPPAVGLPAEEALFVEGRRRLAEPDFSAWARARLFAGGPLGRLLERLDGLPQPAAGGERLLADLDAAASLALWPRLDDAFARAPSYAGAAAETGALARVSAGGAPLAALSARLRARVEELLSLAPGRVSATPVAAGVGRAVVDTARGALMHELTLGDGRIADYVIVAPTEWNFHPAGPLPGWLLGLPEAEARALAPRAVLALDPCVPWALV